MYRIYGGMHQHLIGMLVHFSTGLYVQCRQFCHSGIREMYNCLGEDEEEDDPPPLSELHWL